MTTEKIVEKWALQIMRKTGQDPKNEYKKLEIMNCIMLCFKEVFGMILGIFYPVFIKFVGLIVITISIVGMVLGYMGIQTIITMQPFIGISLISIVLLTWLISFVYFIQTL